MFDLMDQQPSRREGAGKVQVPGSAPGPELLTFTAFGRSKENTDGRADHRGHRGGGAGRHRPRCSPPHRPAVRTGVVFRFGRVIGEKAPGLVVIMPIINVFRKVSFRIVTMPIQSQGIITRDNVSVDVSAVAYYRVVDATKSVVAIENIEAAIDQIAQTTLRKVVGQHTLDEMLAETDRINVDIKEILDVQTEDWGCW